MKEFYENWATAESTKPYRKNILKWKAVNLANLFLRTIKEERIFSICEVGGADGIVLSTVGDILGVKDLVNYELSSEFCRIGKEKYPNIQFINSEFQVDKKVIYDLILLSDIIEHVEDESNFLERVSQSCRYALFKIPIEECLSDKEWVYKIRRRTKPEYLYYGPRHYNGHLRGYNLKKALRCLSRYFDILDLAVSDVLYFYGSPRQRLIKRWFGSRVAIWLWGGALFSLGVTNRHV